MGTVITIVFIISAIIISFLVRLANKKADVIELILYYLNDKSQIKPDPYDKNSSLGDIAFSDLVSMYVAVIHKLGQEKTDDQIEDDCQYLFEQMQNTPHTVNQLASLILHHNGYKLRAIHSRR